MTGIRNADGVGAVAGRDACLTGTWKVDVDDTARQTAAKVGNGATGAGTTLISPAATWRLSKA